MFPDSVGKGEAELKSNQFYNEGGAHMSCYTLRVLLLKATKRDDRYYYSRDNTSSLLDDDNILKWGVRNKSMMNDHAVQVDLHVLMSDTI